MTELAEKLPVSRPAVSQHLRVLKQAGLVTERREGTRRLYRIDPDGLGELRDYVDVFVNHIADWWPLETHSQSAMQENGRPDTLVFEARAGGEVYEQRGEERHHWAFVTVWEPPHRFVLD